MALHESELAGDPDQLVAHLESAIMRGSVSATREEVSDREVGGARMLVRVYERYSAMGGNRVSLTVSVLAVGERLAVTMTAAGGSQALFFKVNTVGEETFLDKAVKALVAFDRGGERRVLADPED